MAPGSITPSLSIVQRGSVMGTLVMKSILQKFTCGCNLHTMNSLWASVLMLSGKTKEIKISGFCQEIRSPRSMAALLVPARARGRWQW